VVQEGTITQLIQKVSAGDDKAHARLWSLLYDELHQLAQVQMASESPGHTLQPTALIHETYLRLFGGNGFECENRKHFLAIASKVMRQIRVDAARRRKRLKRGGNANREKLENQVSSFESDSLDLLAIDEALERLNGRDPRKAQIVELRYFGGLSIDDCAETLNVSARTIDYEWRFARAWLHKQLSAD